jgi:diguanylate cyclase (GGDEF)-like protein
MKCVESVIANVKNLPSLPTIALKIIQEIKRDKISNTALSEIISYDPALTAKILKIANSAFYALPDGVDSIDRAVNILGQEALKNIALSFVIVKGLKRNNVDNFDHELFWKRSITAAVSAEMLTSKLRVNSGDTFIIPLLMDIGVLVMYLSDPNEYFKVFDEKRVTGLTTAEVEKTVFGYDHQELGSSILMKWKIPENISLPIAYHHNPETCPAEIKDLVEVLHLADIASSVYHSSNSTKKMEQFRELLKEKLKISDEEVGEFIDAIAEKTIDVLGTFEIDPGDMKPYSQILEEANTELGRMNLSYEQLVMELKQEKSNVEILARDLKEANDKLRGLAFEDGLTMLFNHRYFQDHLEREISRVNRYSHLLSLIMIDIDHFKKFNDTYGHQQGDTVLRSVAEVLNDSIRKPDIAARYGGEEFAIILPETDLKGALVLAERIRQFIEELEVKIDNQVLKVTISLGITSYDPAKGMKKKEEIIESADKALYNSKNTGRNKLSIAK